MKRLSNIVTFLGVPYPRLIHNEWQSLTAEVCASLVVIENEIKLHKQVKITLHMNYAVTIENIPDKKLQIKIISLLQRVEPKLELQLQFK